MSRPFVNGFRLTFDEVFGIDLIDKPPIPRTINDPGDVIASCVMTMACAKLLVEHLGKAIKAQESAQAEAEMANTLAETLALGNALRDREAGFATVHQNEVAGSSA